MGGVEDQVGRQPQYEAFADEFLDHAEHSLFNAYYDRPACLDLLGDVTGKRVLDAACGPGLYAAELLRRGASVVGFDHSPRMIEICRERAGQGDFRAGPIRRAGGTGTGEQPLENQLPEFLSARALDAFMTDGRRQ